MSIARVDIGFHGGQVLALRLKQSEHDSLAKQLGKGADGWHEVAAEDSIISVDLGQVVYVRRDAEHSKVGF